MFLKLIYRTYKKNNMKFNITDFLLFILIINSLIQFNYCLSASDTKISASRNSNRANICQYFSASYTSTQKAKSLSSFTTFNYMQDSQIKTLLQTKNFSSPSITTFMVALPHMVCLLVLIVMTPILFCCCMWPQKYPICKDWRKPEKDMYTKMQLKWPAYTTLVLYLVIIAGALTALIKAPDIINYYNDVGCKNAAIFDDMLNGRVSPTVSNRFFVGLLPFKSQLNVFNASLLATFFSDSSTALSTGGNVRTKQSTVQSTIQSIYTSFINTIYANAFSSDGIVYYPVQSGFKTLFLGPSGNRTTILGNIKSSLTTIFNEVNLALDSMISAWNSLSASTESGVRTQIGNFSNAILSFQIQLQSFLNAVGDNFYNNQLYNQLYTAVTIFYAAVFAFALLGLLATILLVCFTVVRIRLVMYFTCGFLTFFSIIGFLLLIYLGVMQPQISQTCAYVDKKLLTGTGTQQLLTTMGYGSYANKITNCMNDGNGKLMDKLNLSFSNSFDQMNVIAQGTQPFNDKIPSFTSDNIDAPFTSSSSVISLVNNAQVWDITDTVAIGHVNKVVSKSYTVGATCNALKIAGDVWMPSYELYTCPGGKSKLPLCNDLSNIVTCPLGCYQILNEFISPSGDPNYATHLGSRYNAITCNYYNYIINLHQNWNVPRRSKMASITTTINSLYTTTLDYVSEVGSVKASLNSFTTTMQSNMDSMTNNITGTFNGVDCRVIAQSIYDFRDSFCIGLYQSVLYNIVCLCLISYGTLLLACFVTCAGVRHFRHLQKMQLMTGYKGNPISLSDTRIMDK